MAIIIYPGSLLHYFLLFLSLPRAYCRWLPARDHPLPILILPLSRPLASPSRGTASSGRRRLRHPAMLVACLARFAFYLLLQVVVISDIAKTAATAAAAVVATVSQQLYRHPRVHLGRLRCYTVIFSKITETFYTGTRM